MEGIKLSAMQIVYMKHIYKKGFAAYSSSIPELEQLIEVGFVSKSIIGPFEEIGYKLTEKGNNFIYTLTRL